MRNALNLSLRALTDKFNPFCRRALENAVGLCFNSGAAEIHTEHLFIKMLENDEKSDVSLILQYYDVEASKVIKALQAGMDRLQVTSERRPEFSEDLFALMQAGWLFGSIDLNQEVIRSGSLLLAELQRVGPRWSRGHWTESLENVNSEDLKKEFLQIVAGSIEEVAVRSDDGSRPDRTGMQKKTEFLNRYTTDLTACARQGGIDPVLARDEEVQLMIDILCRRRKNNPILVGEPGVGKTAVVEALAQRIITGDVPPLLASSALRSLDLGLLQAGASVKGEFENRLKSVIEEVKSSQIPIVLFIDEAHALIGAGGAAGSGDAANLLKPALARGELRTVAATTWAEYKKYIEKDAALERRFQVVKVDEPDEERAVIMLRSAADQYAKHHKVRILEEAVHAAVKLSSRYIVGRQLPDKAIDLLDTAAARVAVGQSSTPPLVDRSRKRVLHLEAEIRSLNREIKAGAKELAAEYEDKASLCKIEKAGLAELESRWEREKGMVESIISVRSELESSETCVEFSENKRCTSETEDGETPPSPDRTEAELKSELSNLFSELSTVQDFQPLVQPWVTESTIASIVSDWTGIPLGKMLKDELQGILNLKDRMEQRVIGQSRALEIIADRLHIARSNLQEPGKPMGVFLLVGPSGVGKTYTAETLADLIFGGERHMVSINMSEYQEAHTVSGLKGSPPGYVGYGEGGILTEAVRKRPYTVVLLDEVEKAHPDVMELFYQVFDKGILNDAEGREISFKNTIILMTSNLASDVIERMCAADNERPTIMELEEAIRPYLVRHFKPALIGRMNVVPYYPIDGEGLNDIIRLKLKRAGELLRVNHGMEFGYSDDVIDRIAGQCRNLQTGARNIDTIISNTMLPQISRELLGRLAADIHSAGLHVDCEANGEYHFDFATVTNH